MVGCNGTVLAKRSLAVLMASCFHSHNSGTLVNAGSIACPSRVLVTALVS